MRRSATLAFALLVTLAIATAQTETPSPAPVAAGQPARAWELTGNVRAAFGQKQNVLLSAVRSEDSAFAQAEGEVFWWRKPTERFEAMAFANAAFTRFLESTDNPREFQAYAHAEARWFAPHRLEATAVAEGYDLDQVFDLSASNAAPRTARLAVRGALASIALRWDLLPGTWLELKPAEQRDRYNDGEDDNRQRLAGATLGHAFLRGRVELSVTGQTLRRDYDRRRQYTVAGRAIAGSLLAFDQREGEARVVVRWDQAQRWSTTLSATTQTNADNGSGFFNYHYRRARHEIAWTNAPWKARLTTRAGRYDYDVQTQGIGINPPPRMKEEFFVQARAEREWKHRLTIFAEYTWERSRSNDPLASYRAKTARLGLDRAL